MHEADKVVDPVLKPKTQDTTEGILKPIKVIPKSVSLPKRIILPGQGRACGGRKVIGPALQPLPH